MSTFEQLSQSFESLYTDLDPDFALKYFKKKSYLPFMDTYVANHSEIYDLIRVYVAQDENWRDGMKQIMDSVSENAKKAVQKVWFFQRSRVQMDRTCMVTFFMIPGLYELNIPEKDEIAKMMAASWTSVFHSGELTAADKQTIQSGFVTKIFGVPINND